MATALAPAEDYYALLDIPPDASLEVIKTAYRALALKYHPDKNNDATATAHFQRLARAWDTLRDEGRRREYNLERGLVSGRVWRWTWTPRSSADDDNGNGQEEPTDDDLEWARQRQQQQEQADEEAHQTAVLARQRREEIDRAVMANWWAACEGNGAGASYTSSGQRIFPDEAGRRQRARVWKAVAREDYFARLRGWLGEREKQLVLLRDVRGFMGRKEAELRAQPGEERVNIGRIFKGIHESIALQKRKSQVPCLEPESHVTTEPISPELMNTTAYKLIQAIGTCRKRARQILHTVSTTRRLYEEEESRIRQIRVSEALDILGPRDINPPLFCAVDRRGRTINAWRALGRVKIGRRFATLEAVSEGAWHVEGQEDTGWMEVEGEKSCGRCEREAMWHFLGGLKPKACPGCDMVVCGDCERELGLLRDYQKWLASGEDGKGGDNGRESLFSLDFDWNESGYS